MPASDSRPTHTQRYPLVCLLSGGNLVNIREWDAELKQLWEIAVLPTSWSSSPSNDLGVVFSAFAKTHIGYWASELVQPVQYANISMFPCVLQLLVVAGRWPSLTDLAWASLVLLWPTFWCALRKGLISSFLPPVGTLGNFAWIVWVLVSHPNTKFCYCRNKINILVYATVGDIFMKSVGSVVLKCTGRMKYLILIIYGFRIWNEGNTFGRTT